MSDFKFGTWYPIETYKKTHDGGRGLFSVPTAASGWTERKTLDTWVPGATHWMPLPPSPEEMEKMALVPKRQLALYQNLKARTVNLLELMEKEGLL